MAGIYIHIPFCKQACSYCNFHFSTSGALKTEMIEAIAREIRQSPKTTEAVGTIYFGGGTPSLLNEEELTVLMNAIRKTFDLCDDTEITLEANPDDINPGALDSWKGLGINRLSLGVQSFAENELQWMNRAHSANQSLQSLEDITNAGFNNFSADLIYGSPFLSDDDLISSLDTLEKYNTPHISAYALTVEPKTNLHHQILQNKSLPVDPDKQASQFRLLSERLTGKGFEHYEISNFAKPGFFSRHNRSYWAGIPYLGFGPSAHSYDGISKRKWNIANNALYIKSIQNGLEAFEEETLTADQQLNEFIMISLRTSEGINLDILKEKFGEKEMERVLNQSRKYISEGLMSRNDNLLFLSMEGKFLADGIAADLFK